MSWKVVFNFVLGSGHLTQEHGGSGPILTGLQSSWGTKGELLMVSWSLGGSDSSSWNNSFLQALITKLISYYLN